MGERHDPPFGVWLVDKPAGPTSHDVVAAIRRGLPKGTRVGHAGTLDPFATGLLVVLVGRATRLVPYLTGLDKTYVTRVRLGATSATGDPEGPIEATGRETPDMQALSAAVAALPGRRRQRVPALSAVRVDGERLYKRARRGETTDLPEREIVVESARCLGADLAHGNFDLEVRVSKGTYIRRLVSDLGDDLGCGSYCETLRRTTVGALRVEDAVPPAGVTARGGVDPVIALSGLERRDLNPAEAHDARHGRTVPGAASGPVALVADGCLIGVGHPREDGTLRPKVVLA